MKKSVIIVGGGIGGTAVGALLAHKGFQVQLFDKNSLIGGRCTTYEKEGFKIDVGVHLFGEGAGGPLQEITEIIELSNSIQWELSRNPRPLLCYKGEKSIYSRETMAKLLPAKEQENVSKFFADCMSIRKKRIEELYYTDLETFIKQYSDDPNFHAFIGMICGQYFCVAPNEASTGEFIRSFRGVVNKRASAYPRGGCIAIPEAYVKGIEKYGGKVHLNTEAKRIIVEGEKAIGIELKDGSTHCADVIISNADIQNTVNNLVGEKHFPKDYVKRVNKLTYAQHCLAIKVALDKKVTDQKLIMNVHIDYSDMGAYIEQIIKGQIPDEIGGMITIPSNYDPHLAPEGKQLIFSGTAISSDWRNQNWKKWGERCLESLQKVIPEIEGHVMWYNIDTPELVEQYAGEYGNIIGVGQTVDQVKERRPSQISPITNLYIVGCEAGGWGIGTELAANSALELTDILTKKEP
ncbi:MAG TPA: NAD(P)/FAD-dependent oxidoreductase [Candidatus Deferrimicrobium sp.]|nr:NAD(P)/FAD-dependent oxidoreductase [Candidatus Deferrimicrobium sp.]